VSNGKEPPTDSITREMKTVLDFLNELERRKIHYTLQHNRANALMVLIAVPSERWEAEFFDDGQIEVEVFKSNGEITGAESIKRLFETFSE
jgi:hypothetical protein